MTRARRTLLTASLLGLCCACSNLIGLREGRPYPAACEGSGECREGEQCVLGRCEPLGCQEPGETLCSGLTVKQCGDDGQWTVREECSARCELGACKPPPSCDSIALCPEGVSCCKADVVEGGSFELRYAYGQPSGSERQYMQDRVERRVRTFALDRFEVTVSRFRRFVDGFGATRRPEPGAGAYPGISGSGWSASWSDDYAALPLSQAGLEQQLDHYGQRFDEAELANLPVRGVNWYVATAFCIWDGGRLPSESEWSYAASGGSDDRDYPWLGADLSSAIDPGRAWYAVAGPQPVGTRPGGRARWNHEDLAGNVREWVFDGFREQPERGPCAAADGGEADNRWACLQLEPASGTNRVLRGGAYSDDGALLQNVRRTAGPSERGDPTIGFRCARDLDTSE
jgi:formylglycine-generating enzyme